MLRLRALALVLVAALWGLAGGALADPAGEARIKAMPLTELPKAGSGDTLVVAYSGDGGWAAIDRGIAAGFNSAGMPVVGVNSLNYFLTRRTPEGAAADLAAVIDHYTTLWGKRRVILLGYSFGADALPVIVPRLPPATRAKLRLLALVSVFKDGELQFHPGDWLNLSSPDAFPTAPAIMALKGLPMVCVYGDGDKDDACHTFPPDVIRQVRLPGDHHFDKSYDGIARAILQAAP